MKHNGESETKGGFYWKRGEWEIVTVDGKSGTLPGPPEVEYIRVPGLLLVPIALIVSIAYVVFLPLIGFAMLFRALAGKVAERLPSPARAPVEALQEEIAVEPENLVEAEVPVDAEGLVDEETPVGAGKWIS